MFRDMGGLSENHWAHADRQHQKMSRLFEDRIFDPAADASIFLTKVFFLGVQRFVVTHRACGYELGFSDWKS